MNLENQTPVQVGLSGVFAGHRYTVIARALMGMSEEGETYYWDEFYLSDGTDRMAQLVHEIIDGNPHWRLFTFFEPTCPLTLAEARSKKVGDAVNLEGAPGEVTLVGQSRVYHIEGQPPEWLQVGDVADYFNADSGKRTVVVSWSGDEIEFYRGLDLDAEAVAAAFGLKVENFKRPSAGGGARAGLVVAAVFALILGVPVIYFLVNSSKPGRRPSGPTFQTQTIQRQPAPRAPFEVGATVQAADRSYRIVAHEVIEVSRVNRHWDRHHYHVVDDAGAAHRLIHVFQPGAKDWMLFTSVEPARDFTPFTAATKRAGDPVDAADFHGQVTELHLARVQQTRGPVPPEAKSPARSFNFLARGTNEWLLASWDENRLSFQRGRPVAVAAR